MRSQKLHKRVVVIRVSDGDPAEKAGLETGNIILKVGNASVRGLANFYRAVWSIGTAGVDVPLTVLQGADIRELTVRSLSRHNWLKLMESY